MNLLLILVSTSIISWWLSGYDSKLTGENKAVDLTRRIIRCAITVLLMALGVGSSLWAGRFGGFVYIALVFPLALIWVGCASELLARGFHNLIDSPGAADSDPNKLTADLDQVAALYEQGRTGEAIGLCTKLVESREGSGLAMETVLFKLYDQAFSDERLLLSPALAEVQKLRAQGHIAEAESRLQRLLKQEPENVGAAMLLLHLYIRDSRSSEKASGLLEDLKNRSGVPPFFADYARQRVGEWLTPRSKAETTQGIESLLVDMKRLGRPEQTPHSAAGPRE